MLEVAIVINFAIKLIYFYYNYYYYCYTFVSIIQMLYTLYISKSLKYSDNLHP